MMPRAELGAPSPFALQVLDVLKRYVSPPTARSLLDLATRRQSVAMSELGLQHMDRISNHLRDGLTLFVPKPADITACMTDLERVGGRSPGSSSPEDRIEIALRSEDDIVKARVEARAISQRAGFAETARTRVATAVSELARNVVRYAGQGTITLSAVLDANRGWLIDVLAADRGPGIANLSSVLDGTYRSRHGMGLGLRGVRSIAEHFDVQTAPNRGTRVHVRVGNA